MEQKNKHEMGLYEKYVVRRTDGSDEPGGKHCGCQYFVLDMTHDPYAVPALRAYVEACAEAYPALASDLRQWLESKSPQPEQFMFLNCWGQKQEREAE